VTEKQPKGRKALGKGLGALIPSAGSSVPGSPVNRGYMLCPIERIYPQTGQPRQHFNEEQLAGLVDSIKEQGVIQPAIVRRREKGDGYELIAGERRWRAAQMAGLKELPVVVKDVDSADAFEMALVENIQREDLNPIEEAEAIKRLIDEHGYTQEEVATRIGRQRVTVTNCLRLLGLPEAVRAMVIEGDLTEGHARALLQAPSQTRMIALARVVKSKGLSVRETERRARAEAASPKAASQEAKQKSPEVISLIEKLQRTLGARVDIKDTKGKGRIEITYTSYDELDGILNRIFRV
jgi:ParB family transcriptional regulator, chromosome partitioning protein